MSRRNRNKPLFLSPIIDEGPADVDAAASDGIGEAGAEQPQQASPRPAFDPCRRAVAVAAGVEPVGLLTWIKSESERLQRAKMFPEAAAMHDLHQRLSETKMALPQAINVAQDDLQTALRAFLSALY